MISDGASNPAGVARALVDAIDECRKETPYRDPRGDPAVMLITHQLAFLLSLPTCERLDDWDTWRKLCRAHVDAATAGRVAA